MTHFVAQVLVFPERERFVSPCLSDSYAIGGLAAATLLGPQASSAAAAADFHDLAKVAPTCLSYL